MSRLHVVTAIFNPAHWESRPALCAAFIEHMLESGTHLTVVECAYDDRPFEVPDRPEITHLKVRSKRPLWAKEVLLNIGIASLPDDAQFVAWIDADLTFQEPRWASETVRLLHEHNVVQPWSHCHDLGPHGERLNVHTAFCKRYQDGTPIVQGMFAKPGQPFAHPGYAWAARRDVLAKMGGLLDVAIMGAADHHMAMAMIGRTADTIHPDATDAYKAHAEAWQTRACMHVAGRLACVGGDIMHNWHGPKKKRGYRERWDVLTSNAYDPDTDIVRNADGVYEFAGNKPRLEREVLAYFLSRAEDDTTL